MTATLAAALLRLAGGPGDAAPVDDVHAMSLGGRILVAVLTALTLLFLLRLVRRGQLRGKYALLWLAVGAAMVGFAIYPDVLVPVSDVLGISYEPAILFLAAIGFLFIVIVHFSYELSRLEDRTRTLAEELALLRADTTEPAPPDAAPGDAPPGDAPPGDAADSGPGG
ncbi:MAG: DUF2304 domain-containing protein [Microthrixaceae bacterium]|nr:DUF2304 domain-containing protein [Microthrixaceae bacterium]